MPTLERERIQAAVAEAMPDAVATRRYLHQNPELSDCEQNTSALVADKLRSLGFENIRTNVGGYGVVAELVGTAPNADPKRLFALRADMDALPIHEETDVPYKSCKPGVMHACGHDGHTSTLLGTAAALSNLRDLLEGTVRFVFQPAEETVGGAFRMCREGVMEGVEAIVALHGWPGMKVGQIGVRSGAMMASSDTFDIVIQGKGSHAAMPHASIDPIIVAAHLTTALQTISSREVSPVEPIVVTVSQIHAGTAYNIIPETALMKGTVRCLSKTLREEAPQKIERMARGICEAFRADYKFSYRHGTGVTVNTPEATNLVAKIGEEILGKENVIELEAPSMGAEDFAAYLEHVPGSMFRLGTGEHKPTLHHPRYDFGDESVPVGMALFSEIALRYFRE